MRLDKFFQGTGIRWWQPVLVFFFIAAVIISVSVSWLASEASKKRRLEQSLVSIKVSNAKERIALGLEKTDAMALGIAGYVRSQMHLHKTPHRNMTSAELEAITLDTIGFGEYCYSQNEAYPGLVDFFTVRPVGYLTNQFPNRSTGVLTQDLYPVEAMAIHFSLTRNYPVYFVRHNSNGELTYMPSVPLYTTANPTLEENWFPADGPPKILSHWWGVVNVVIDIRSFVEQLNVLDEFRSRGWDLLISMEYSYKQDASGAPADLAGGPTRTALANTTDVASITSHGDALENVLSLNEFTRLIVCARPRAGWKQGARSVHILLCVIGALVFAALVVALWMGALLWRQIKRERRENRLQMAPKSLPVTMCMVEIVGVTAVWHADPITMAYVSARYHDHAKNLAIKYDAYQCRSIGDGILLTGRSTSKLIALCTELYKVMQSEPWSRGELEYFPDRQLRIHATVHSCSRAKFRVDVGGQACDYTGDDIRDLLQLHLESFQRRHPVLLTDAALSRVPKEERAKFTKSDDLMHLQEVLHERPPNLQLWDAESQNLFPLYYEPSIELPVQKPVSGDGTAVGADDEDGSHHHHNNLDGQACDGGGDQGGDESHRDANAASAGTALHTQDNSNTTQGNKVNYVCSPAIADRLMELINQCVPGDKQVQQNIFQTAAYFYEAYSIAFSPFEEKQLERIFCAVQDAFTLAANNDLLERTELQVRLAVRCSRIFHHAFQTREDAKQQ